MKHPAIIAGKSNTSSLFVGFLVGGIALIFTLLHSLYPDVSTQEVNAQPGRLEARYRAAIVNIFETTGAYGGVENCSYSFKRFALSCGIIGTDLKAIRLAMTNRGWLFAPKQANESSRAGLHLERGLSEGKDLATFDCSEEKRILDCTLRLAYKMNL
jgi:hypothetical protein